MNNNQMNFDPMTGKPINSNEPQNNITTQNTVQTNNSQQYSTNQPEQTMVENSFQNTQIVQPIQQQMQNIPTVEQTKQEFINNTQANNVVKNDEKNDGPNIVFLIILFGIIFASIFFLFPYLQKIL